jgi:hypothetical protein
VGILYTFLWGEFIEMRSKDALADRMNMIWLAEIYKGMNRYS